MLKVRNKKAIANLSNKSFKASKTRNKIAILAIALTAMLFSALFTIGLGAIENFQLQTMRQSGGDSHGVFKNLTQEEYEILSQHPSIQESADCMMMADEICNPEFLKRHVEVWYYPQYHYKHCFIEILDGRAPQTADEILLDETSMDLLGLEPKSGQTVTLEMRLKNSDTETIQRMFTVCGVIRSDPALNVGFAIVADAYRQAHADELTYTYEEDYSNTGTIRMDVNFSNSLNIQDKLDKVILESGYSIQEGDENFIASNANWAYISDGMESGDPITLFAVGGALVLILLTGYLIIYNIFQISVIRDIRFYGLLKTIGTTSRQIRRILMRQALLLSVIGIPIGLILGFIAGKFMVPLVLARTAYAGGEVVVSIQPLIFLAAALFALLTVFLSAGRPARIAAKVSPIEAVRYTESGKQNRKKKRSTDGGKLTRMALSNLGRNKTKTVLVILSLSLSLVLLNSVFTITHAFDMDKYLNHFVTNDFMIGHANYFGQTHYYGYDEEEIAQESLTESFITACEQLDGFQNGGRIYSAGTYSLKKEGYVPPSSYPLNENGELCMSWNGQLMPLNTDPNGNYMAQLYGLDDFILSSIEPFAGETDLATIKEKLSTGKYILCSVSVDDNNFILEEEIMHQPGDKITLVDWDGNEREFEVLSLIKENYYGLTNRLGNTFSYYTTSAVFKEMESAKFLMAYSFDAEDSKESEISAFLKEYTETVEPLMHYESKAYWVNEFTGVQNLLLTIGGFLAAVIGLIGVLNFINSVLTSIVTRRSEFAMLQAIGMTRKQLISMLILEGLYYAGFTMVFSLVFGGLFSLTVLHALTGGIWFMSYHFLLWPMLVTFPILLFLGLLVPRIAFHFNSDKSVVELLHAND